MKETSKMRDVVDGTAEKARKSKAVLPAAIRRGGLFWMAWLFPWLILAVSLTMTYQLKTGIEENAFQEKKAYFDFLVREAKSRIEQRMLAYEQVLRGAQGLFISSARVGREDFRAYVNALRLEENYPGIQGVGFSLIVPKAEKDRHVAAIRKEGFPEYTIVPKGERDIYTSIIYLEPFTGRNLRAFGYDMYSEPIRRVAMVEARDLGKASLSGKVKLVQETDEHVQSGFLMYLPVFKRNAPQETIQDRRGNIIGWVYAPFRMDDLMTDLLGERAHDLDIEIYDGEEVSDSTRMYHSGDSRGSMAAGHLKASNRLVLAGHPWTVVTYSHFGLEKKFTGIKSNFMALTGTAVSLLLALLAWLLVNSWAGAVEAARMSRELFQSENRFRVMFERSPLGVALVESRTEIIDEVNPRFAEIVGRTREELLRINWKDITHPDDVQKSLDSMALLNVGKISGFDLEKRYIRPDGTCVWVSMIISPIISGKEAPRRHLCMVEDITKRKQTEERIKTFAFAIENSYDGVLFVDVSGNITFANKTALGVLGYTWDELRQLNVAQLDEASDTAKKIKEETMSSGGWSGELVSRKKNGELFPVFVTTSLVKDGNGNIVAIMSHFRDITEHKKIEAALKATEAELVHVSRIAVLGQITAAVAHEVNQPLGAILNRASAAQMILSQSNPDIKRVQTILAKIVEEDERAGSVIRKIRELARKDAPQNELLDVDIIIRQVAAIINSREILKGAKVDLDLRPPRKFVLGDKIQLQQVLLNLITNAVEAGVDKSARKIRIISEVHDSGLVTVSVSDSGLGIDEKEIEKLFQPFYTTKTEGLGIGLFICRSIIQAHGGSLTARNNPDKGATFYFSLPIAKESVGGANEHA